MNSDIKNGVIRSYKTTLVPWYDEKVSTAEDPLGENPKISYQRSHSAAMSSKSDLQEGKEIEEKHAGISWLQRHGVAISSKSNLQEVKETIEKVVGLDAALWQHHVITNVAKGAFVDWLATMAASITPTAGPSCMKQKDACLLAAHWLSVEDKRQAEMHQLPVVRNVVETFKNHLEECNLNSFEVDQWVKLCLPVLDRREAILGLSRPNWVESGQLVREPGDRSDSVVVDRRQCYLNIKNLKAGDKSSDNDCLCYRDTIGRIDKKSVNKQARTLMSERFGTGKGSNDAEREKLANKVIEVINDTSDVDSLSIKEKLATLRDSSELKKIISGRPPKWIKILSEFPSIESDQANPERIQELKTSTENYLVDKEKNKGLEKGERWWTQSLRYSIEFRIKEANRVYSLGLDDKRIKSLFDVWKTDGRDEIATGAMGHFSSRRSWTKNQIDEILKALKDADCPDKLKADCPDKLKEKTILLDLFKDGNGKEENYRLGRAAIQVFISNKGSLYKSWIKSKRPNEVIEKAKKNLGKRYDPDFVLRLAQVLTEKLKDSDGLSWEEEWPKLLKSTLEDVKAFDTMCKGEDRFMKLRMPSLTMPDPVEHPLASRHGAANCWHLASLSDDGCCLTLATGEKVNVRLKSDRYKREILRPSQDRSEGLVSVVRDNHLGRQSAGIDRDGKEKVYVPVENVSLNIECVYPKRLSAEKLPWRGRRDRRWIGIVPAKIVPRGPVLTWKEGAVGAILKNSSSTSKSVYFNWPFQTLNVDWRVLGVDLGVRTAASWSVLKVSESNDGVSIEGTKGMFALCEKQGKIDKLGERITLSRKQKRIVKELAQFVNNLPYSSCDVTLEEEISMLQVMRLLNEANEYGKRLMALVHYGREKAGDVVVTDSICDRQYECSQSPEEEKHKPNCLSKLAIGIGWRDESQKVGKDLVEVAINAWREHDDHLDEMFKKVESMLPITHMKRGRLGRGDPLTSLRIIDEWYKLRIRRHCRPQPSSPQGRKLPKNFLPRLKKYRMHLRSEVSNQLAAELVKVALENKCQGIVLEDLSTYKPDRERTKFENRLLRLWSQARVVDAVRQECETYGLAFRAVNPFDTSHCDFANTSEKGVRAEKVDYGYVETQTWKDELEKAKEVNGSNGTDNTNKSRYAKARIELDKWLNGHANRNLPKELVVPREGGHYLVSPFDKPGRWHDCLNEGKLQDADLNASAVVGLRGLESKLFKDEQ